jgi:hypothetical protein
MTLKVTKLVKEWCFHFLAEQLRPTNQIFKLTPNQPIFKRSLRNAVVFCLRYEEFKFHGREKWLFNKTL